MNIQQHLSLSGYFKITAVDEKTNQERLLSDWFPNGILNSGLNRWGTGKIIECCRVGSSNTAVDVENQTDLLEPKGGTATPVRSAAFTASPPASAIGTGSEGDPYYIAILYSFTFPAGAVTGVWREIGIDYAAGPGKCWSRAKITNPQGADAEITVLSTEALVVQYQLRIYVPTIDVSGTASGYPYTIRAALCTSASDWGNPLYLNSTNGIQVTNNSTYWPKMHTGAANASRSGGPGGTASASTGTVVPTSTDQAAFYSDWSYTKTVPISWPASVNVGTGIATGVSIVNSGSIATVTHAAHGMSTGDYVAVAGASLTQNNGIFQITYVNTTTYTYTMSSSPGANPTGTITAIRAIRALSIPWSFGTFQIDIPSGILKNNTNTLTVSMTVTWGRK